MCLGRPLHSPVRQVPPMDEGVESALLLVYVGAVLKVESVHLLQMQESRLQGERAQLPP